MKEKKERLNHKITEPSNCPYRTDYLSDNTRCCVLDDIYCNEDREFPAVCPIINNQMGDPYE